MGAFRVVGRSDDTVRGIRVVRAPIVTPGAGVGSIGVVYAVQVPAFDVREIKKSFIVGRTYSRVSSDCST